MPVSDPWELTHGQDANKNGNVSETIYDGNRSKDMRDVGIRNEIDC